MANDLCNINFAFAVPPLFLDRLSEAWPGGAHSSCIAAGTSSRRLRVAGPEAVPDFCVMDLPLIDFLGVFDCHYFDSAIRIADDAIPAVAALELEAPHGRSLDALPLKQFLELVGAPVDRQKRRLRGPHRDDVHGGIPDDAAVLHLQI